MNYFFYNEHNLEGNICNIIFFLYIKEFIVKNNIQIKYFCANNYVLQLRPFIQFKNIVIDDLNKKPKNSFHLDFYNPSLDFDTILKKRELNKNNLCFDSYCKYFYSNIMHRNKIFLRVKEFFYHLPKLKDIEKKINQTPDIFILNSHINSNFHLNLQDVTKHFNSLADSYNILSTSELSDKIPFLQDFNLINIAAISTKAPIIISLSSELLPLCLNKYTLANVRQFIVLDKFSFISFQNFIQISNLHEIHLNYLQNFVKVSKQILKEETKEAKEINLNSKKEINIIEETQIKEKYSNFDWKAYVFFNDDLNFNTELESWHHFINHGIKEKRIYYFDWEKYVKSFHLENVCKNKEEAFSHLVEKDNTFLFLHSLKYENIDLNLLSCFDWKFYTSFYADLKDLKNFQEAFDHYIHFGINEKRKITDFDWIDYLFLNKDLLEIGINDENKAFQHWLEIGKAQGRQYKIKS